jgi:taurine dioxygenase
MPFSVEPLSPLLPFGKVIRGLTAAEINDRAVRARLCEFWRDAEFLLFRDSAVTETFHLDLSRVFGPLQVHRTREYVDANNPELVTLTTPSGSEWEVDGEVGEFQSWHKDLVYADKINRGGILRALKTSSRGGRTGFLDLVDAYRRLPEAPRKRIADLRVVYRMAPYEQHPYATRSKVRTLKQSDALKSLYRRLDKDFPPVSHPLVFIHPESGQTVLNFSPRHALYVEGLPEDESHAVLEALADHVFACPAYHHAWTTDDMILWDNWRMLHAVSLIPRGEERIMQRTTVAGDYGLGRVVPDPDFAAPARFSRP